ncbi:acylneuraminate cytidylyltransferase [Limnospira maxima CS-328]|uniref:Acylneuraminate cytidylyltransferase n=1 Tax=Limnospira maxima CS-328 TaxID=513049 RepID=B5W6H4_LIMMA|nr:acylneuraminate cytidylyltransferase [Limnospira maxima]EDZ92882.1 acylneuraminate cytidylyltransferase [Limnospira maxima CS-328]MDC0836475.1 acylneuraminate cytidylyltransferase [Limnoraphis robusta]
MQNFSDISVIIPVREGSSRIKEKIFLPFHQNISLLEWKIAQLKKVQSDNLIFLSSNSQRVKEIAHLMGVEFLPRSDYLSDGHQASFSEVITGIIKDIPTNHFAWVTVVVPLMSPQEYSEGFNLYIDQVVNQKNNDSLVSVNLLKEYLWNDKKPINYKATKEHTISQDLPNIYKVTNGLYMRNKKDTLSEGYFLGANPYKHIVSKISGVDIDEYDDYQIAMALKQLYFYDSIK